MFPDHSRGLVFSICFDFLPPLEQGRATENARQENAERMKNAGLENAALEKNCGIKCRT